VLVPGVLEMDLAPALVHYAEHGWARLGRVAMGETLEALRARADDLMLGRVSYPGLFFQMDAASGSYDDLTFGEGYEGPSLEYRKIEKLEQDPLYWAWLRNPLFERIARACIDASSVSLYRAVLFAKGARGGSELPWHQDAGVFWGLDRDPKLQIWTALDDAPEAAGCVEVIDKSHAKGLATRLGGVVPERLALETDAESKVLPLPARAGEVILLHNYLWHRSKRNTTGKPRRAFTVCYMSGATKCTRKKRAPRSFVEVWSEDPAQRGRELDRASRS
jgi:phytanoyl-CoA hydroxylase